MGTCLAPSSTSQEASTVSLALHMVWATPPLRKSMDPPLVSLPCFAALPQLCFQPVAWGLKPGDIVEDRHLGLHNLRLLVANAFGAVQPGNWPSSPLLSLNCTVFESYCV